MGETVLILRVKTQDYGDVKDFLWEIELFNNANKPIVEVEVLKELEE